MLKTAHQNRAAYARVDVTEVFCDFDGTITEVDATDAVLEAFALPAWREWERRWVNGEITSRECLARQVELIRVDQETLKAFAAQLPIDKGVLDLDQRCREHGVPLTIVSDGIDFIVAAVLHRHGLLHLPVFSNHLHWDEQGQMGLSFPFSIQGCHSGAGTCKCAITRAMETAPSRAVYIGDGQSDQCVSAKIQRVFAKGHLRQWCGRQGIHCEPFETLSEVALRLFPKEVL
ncbi:MAG: MtnX-like HAD-IB family phosphatase [Nitrospira sp.]|nr:MtnX-like HAD-IB family phosphatase [Nitrospira sp.]